MSGSGPPRRSRRLRAVVRVLETALSNLSGDEQGIILGQLINPLDPRQAMSLGSACSELWTLLSAEVRRKLRVDHEAAKALCRHMGLTCSWPCKALREATIVKWWSPDQRLTATDLSTLASLGSVLPALKDLSLRGCLHHFTYERVPWLTEGLVAGALPAVTSLCLERIYLGDAGASALAAALDRGALRRLALLSLRCAAIDDAGLLALVPALRRLPALGKLCLYNNPLGDDGLAGLLAPPPTGGMETLVALDVEGTTITAAGCDALVAALDTGALPALENLKVRHRHWRTAAGIRSYDPQSWVGDVLEPARK